MNYLNDDARLATDAEFTKTLTRRKMDQLCKESGIPLKCEGDTVYTDDSDAHTLIFGNTGSKKTRNFCIPSVYTIASAGETMVISDPKGEIYDNTSGYLSQMGYDIKVINLREPEKGSKWNPLILPYKLYKNGQQDRAVELITDFTVQLKSRVHSDRDLYWEEQASDLLIGLILILFECEEDSAKVHMGSIEDLRMLIQLQNGDAENDTFWELVESFPKDSLVRYKLASVYSLRRTDKTLPCILSTLDSMIGIFSFSRRIQNMLDTSEVSYEELGLRKTALFLIIPDEKLTFHFLVSVFIKQCYEQLISTAFTYERKALPVRVNFVLDEFSNFPRIADMPAMISAARSRNIRFILVVQSRRQLNALYGDDAEKIKSNCKNWVFLTCREIGLLQEISELCGTVYINGRGNRPLLGPTQLQRLEIGWEDSQALVMRAQSFPHISWVKDFSCFPQASIPPRELRSRTFRPAPVFSAPAYLYRRLREAIRTTREF